MSTFEAARRSRPLRDSLALVWAVFSVAIAAQAGPPPPGTRPSATLHYILRPRSLADRTEVEVTLAFRPETGGPTAIGLPADCYGTPAIHRYVTLFEGVDGTVVAPGPDERTRVVTPGTDGEARIRYVLSYDPVEMARYAFAPNVGPEHFHLAGCQWMLRLRPADRTRHHEISVVGAPEEWGLYSSLGPDPARLQATGTYDDLVSVMIGGGAGPHVTFEVESRPVSAFVQGRYDIPSQEIVRAIRTIVKGQRTAMDDHEQPFYSVTVLPRPGIIAGTSVRNLFVCFIKDDITREELYGLLAHEMFHTWLPNRIEIALPTGESSIRHEWFSEGVTEYLSRRLMADDGLLGPDQFAELTNRDLYNLADNPAVEQSYAELRTAESEGRYDTAYKKLAYYRGAILALNWDARLAAAGRGRTVLDFVRGLFRSAAESGGRITEDEFFSRGEEYGLDVKGDFERHILRGEPIVPDPHALGPEFRLQATYVPSFDPGFAVRDSFQAGSLQGLRRGGPAERAGLMDGMDFLGVRNSNRFGNAWYADRPLRVLIRNDDGTERAVSYFPHGAPIVVMQYQRR
jgi:predicted metalloprotease with PDZ domain